jgi:hypothetical protein
MPDSQQPPTGGPAYNARDLDAVLSGERYGLPEALRPVAGAMSALRAGPVYGELSGEAAARAMFRTAVPLLTVPGTWAAEAEHGTVTARTLVLAPPGRGQPRRSRHRRRRGTGTSATRWLAVAATGATAVAVVAIAVGLTGVLPDSIRQLGNLGQRSASASASASRTGHSTASQRVDGGASREPSLRQAPAPSSGAQGLPVLCRDYYSFFTHPEPKSSYPAEAALGAKLNALVGGSAKAFGRCQAYLGNLYLNTLPGTSPTSPPGLYSVGPGPTAKPKSNPGAGTYSKRTLPGEVMERSRGSVTAITPKATARPTPMRA